MLTLLAPAIVEAILDGRQGVEVTLPGLMKGVWGEQTITADVARLSVLGPWG